MDWLTQRLKGWRTIAFNALNALVAIAAMPEVANVLPPSVLPYVMLFAALGNMWLRKVTTTPLGKKVASYD